MQKGYGGTRPLSTRPEDNRRVEITVRNDEFDDSSDDDDDDDDDSDANTAKAILRDIDPDLDVACRTNVRVGLVPCGVNNSTIGEWNDSLYERTLRRIQEASKHGVVKGILWHQGESDCGDASSSKYRDMLSRTLNRFRRDLGKPDLLMVGQMGQFTRWHYGQNRVNEAQEIVQDDTQLSFCVVYGIAVTW